MGLFARLGAGGWVAAGVMVWGAERASAHPGFKAALVSNPYFYLIAMGVALLLFAVLLLRQRRETQRMGAQVGSLRSDLQSLMPALTKAPVMLLGFDAQWRLVFWNDLIAEVTSWDLATVQKDPALHGLFVPPEPEKAAGGDGRGGGWPTRETQIVTRSGRERVLSLTYNRSSLPVSGVEVWAVGVEVTRRAKAMELLKGERAVLHAVTQREPLQEVLTRVIEMIERQLPEAAASILLLDKAGKVFVRALGPKLPETYHGAIVGLEIGENAGSCGTAAWRGERVIVEDIETDPLWQYYRVLARAHNLRSCWSMPFKGSDGHVLGTFAIYHSEPQQPTADELTLIKTAADLTALIVGHFQAEEHKQQLAIQMQQTQKLESLGVMAGGIAHDFNNLLMSIQGNAELAEMDVPEGSPVRENLEAIQRSAQQAADLSHQMLAFSGRGRFLIERLNLSDVVKAMEALLRSTIQKSAGLKLELGSALPAIEADATQVRQLVLNLVINASEALEGGEGTITIRTGAIQCSRAYLSETFLDDQLEMGVYVYLEVSDTGIGMDEATRQRIFDPFFTLKFPGRGLGLPASLGIVRGHKGAIKVESAPGAGTQVRALFPTAEGMARIMEPAQATATDWKGQGTILVADDEEAVRMVSQHMLERMGFTVITAGDGEEAIEVFKAQMEGIVCVLLDLTMPVKGGEECLKEIRGLRPEVPVVLSSGYNPQDVMAMAPADGRTGFIQKPYQIQALRESLREALGG